MTMKQAIHAAKAATKEVGYGAVAPHYGRNKRIDRAIRITGTDKDGAQVVADAIIRHLGRGEYRYAPGFAAVWL